MRLEISMNGMVVGVVTNVGPGAQLGLGLRLIDDEPGPVLHHKGAGAPSLPCACDSGRPFDACHGAGGAGGAGEEAS
jgi:hypothetical protein